jgi:16S rRNA (uracil1498-N3)-methyltransferase
MPRFFIDTIPDDEAIIKGEDAKHIEKSLRMTVGEKITLCDCLGNDYLGEIAQMDSDVVRVKIMEIQKSFAEPTVKVTLCQGLPKNDKMDWIIQKSVELGVTQIQPMETSRCVSRPDRKAAEKKIARWQKIALEAAKQSGRGMIPKVETIVSFKEAVQNAEGKKILFYEGGGEKIRTLLNSEDQKATIFIGPEGGFSQEEVQMVTESGGVPATLGPRILRTETAPLAALTAIMMATDNL